MSRTTAVDLTYIISKPIDLTELLYHPRQPRNISRSSYPPCPNCGGDCRICCDLRGPRLLLEGDQNPYTLIDGSLPYLDASDGRMSATQAGYMELEGAKKDAGCNRVEVEGGVSSALGCCNEFNPGPQAKQFRCGTCTNLAPLDGTIVDNFELMAERRGKRKRIVSTPYWPKPVLESERHVNFAEIDRTMAAQADRLAAALKGNARARMIRTIAEQAIRQHMVGRKPSQFQFELDPRFTDNVAVHVGSAYSKARREARAEVERQKSDREGS